MERWRNGKACGSGVHSFRAGHLLQQGTPLEDARHAIAGVAVRRAALPAVHQEAGAAAVQLLSFLRSQGISLYKCAKI